MLTMSTIWIGAVAGRRSNIPGKLGKKTRGIAIWDPQVERPWTEKPHRNLFETRDRLGHCEDIAHWAKSGVPHSLSIPFARLDENGYSRWFPDTEF